MVLFRVFLVLGVSSPLLETCSPDGFAVFRCVSSCFLVLFALGAEDGFFVVFSTSILQISFVFLISEAFSIHASPGVQ